MNPKLKNFLSDVLLVFVLLAIPTAIGLALFLIMGESYYLEVIYVIFGLFELLIMMFRFRRRDSSNVKKNHTIYEDKNTNDYKKFRYEQYLIFLCGALTLLASLIVFFIFR